MVGVLSVAKVVIKFEISYVALVLLSLRAEFVRM
jgi:hypothetical protein